MTTAIDTSNPRLLQERIESIREQILQWQDEIDKYSDVAATIAELPKKLEHKVMVPIGKRAMMPGKIVRSNEILAHLGDEYFAWKTAGDAVDVIERKKKALSSRIKSEQETLTNLTEKKQEVDKLFDIKKLYEDENIKDIQESEENSERHPISQATDEDVEEYFEIEEEERRLNEAAEWDWDDVMKRMEELEAMEERGGDHNEETKEEVKPEPTIEEQVTDLKGKGNEAFGKRRFKESIEFYSQAIALDPHSHILYGNRSAALFRVKNYKEALEDANRAVELDSEWVKGHYRKASALAALERFEEAATAFDDAFALCPTDTKLQEQADEMRRKARTLLAKKQVSFAPEIKEREPVGSTNLPSLPVHAKSTGQPPAPPPSTISTVGAKVFTGSIMERDVSENGTPAATTAAPRTTLRQSRFAGNNPDGDIVTLEPVGEAQPVKRVSRFRAQRAGASQS